MDLGEKSQVKGKTPAFWMGVFEYPSKGKRYYRLMWGAGKQVNGTAHINGGNVRSRLARWRADELRWLILRGASLEQCLEKVRGYGAARRGPKKF